MQRRSASAILRGAGTIDCQAARLCEPCCRKRPFGSTRHAMVDECPCGHMMGWAAFATACAASVYFMYTGDVQRLMEALKGLGATGVVVMVAV